MPWESHGAAESAGFSLIELLTAMAVAAIALALAFGFHHDFGKTIRKAWTQYNRGMAEAAWVSALQRGLMEGDGLLEVSTSSLTFENRVGSEMRLEKTPSDSTVNWNGKALSWKFSKFEIAVSGPDCWEVSGHGDPECRSLLDTLDWNGDHAIRLDELDRNRDGRLAGREIRYVRMVEILWKDDALGPERRIALHPRTRKMSQASSGNGL